MQILPPVLVILIVGLSIAQAHLSLMSAMMIVVFDGLICGLMLATSVLWYLTTKIIPTDSIQLRHLDAIEKGEEFDSKGISPFCQVCQTHISTVLCYLRQTLVSLQEMPKMCGVFRSSLQVAQQLHWSQELLLVLWPDLAGLASVSGLLCLEFLRLIE